MILFSEWKDDELGRFISDQIESDRKDGEEKQANEKFSQVNIFQCIYTSNRITYKNI